MKTTDPFKLIDRGFDDAKQARLPREGEWQQISDHFMPRKDFSVGSRPNELRKRRLTSSVPAVAMRRSSGMLTGFMVDHTQPFIHPNAEMGLIAAGRPSRLDSAARDYLGTMDWAIFGHMMRPRSGYLAATSQISLELVGFGTGVRWIGRDRGFGPSYRARPLRSCWIGVNSDGVVDTIYYEFTMRLWEVLERFENANYVEGWRDADEDKQRQDVTLLHVVKPRKGGEHGGWATRKPYAEFTVSMDKKCVLEERGYDSFPFAVPRLDVEAGSIYGTGMAWHALPDALALSQLQQGFEAQVDNKVQPPLLVPARMFGKALDRRPGALNTYDPSRIGFQSAREAIQAIDPGGDLGVADAYMGRLTANIENALMIDWMRLRDASNVTAEEIRERRDLRIRTMSAVVPGIDRDLMGVDADRTVEILFAEGRLPDPPKSLQGIDVEWDYGGPLQQAQLQRVADAFDRMLDMTAKAANVDPTAPYVLNVGEGLRAVAEAWGQGVEVVRPREQTDALIARHNQQQEVAANRDETMAMATAIRDGGQGFANMATAMQGNRAA